ncbi:hypothetical protein B6S44_24720 [Bosea sp. Tri-44]|nr:hypothetical protein B6S44_24720 [Bosea sp. Tri-44]
MDKAWASAILSECQEFVRPSLPAWPWRATPQSGKSATPLRGEVKPADCGVASLADTSGIGGATLLAFGRFDLTQALSMVTDSL